MPVLAETTATASLPMSVASKPLVEVTNLAVRYRSGALAISDVSFSVHPGQVVALFGPNGAGKTTSVRAVSGFLRTEGARCVAGTVVLDGRRVTNSEPHRMVAAGVALVPERDKCFANLSVQENLDARGRTSRRERDAEHQRIYDLFPILGERRTQLAGRLSGGQRQMLAIARALLCRPRLLILDEMTLGLHHSVHEPLYRTVRAIAAEGTSVVIVDESAGFALQAASHCYLLSGGRVTDEGPAERYHDDEVLAAAYAGARPT